MNILQLFLTLVAVVGALAAFVATRRLFSPKEEESPSSLKSLAGEEKKEISSFGRLDPGGGFLDKLDLFLAKNMGLEARLEELYMLLGRPATPDPLQILHYKETAALLLPVFLFLLFSTPLVIVTAPVGFIIPDLMFSSKIKKRQEEILRNFPSMVDLAALIIESGLDYMTAFDKIIKMTSKKTELEIEMEKTLNEVQLGYSRRDALRRLAMRTGIQEIRSFVGLIIQSDELGTSLVELLRNFSADMRFRRLTKAEKLAAQASTKMLIPLFLFIFPTVFILMLAPMLMDLFKGGGMPF